jgi:hypothetical protein
LARHGHHSVFMAPKSRFVAVLPLARLRAPRCRLVPEFRVTESKAPHCLCDSVSASLARCLAHCFGEMPLMRRVDASILTAPRRLSASAMLALLRWRRAAFINRGSQVSTFKTAELASPRSSHRLHRVLYGAAPPSRPPNRRLHSPAVYGRGLPAVKRLPLPQFKAASCR